MSRNITLSIVAGLPLAIAALVLVWTWPEIQRYLRIRSM